MGNSWIDTAVPIAFGAIFALVILLKLLPVFSRRPRYKSLYKQRVREVKQKRREYIENYLQSRTEYGFNPAPLFHNITTALALAHLKGARAAEKASELEKELGEAQSEKTEIGKVLLYRVGGESLAEAINLIKSGDYDDDYLYDDYYDAYDDCYDRKSAFELYSDYVGRNKNIGEINRQIALANWIQQETTEFERFCNRPQENQAGWADHFGLIDPDSYELESQNRAILSTGYPNAVNHQILADISAAAHMGIQQIEAVAAINQRQHETFMADFIRETTNAFPDMKHLETLLSSASEFSVPVSPDMAMADAQVGTQQMDQIGLGSFQDQVANDANLSGVHASASQEFANAAQEYSMNMLQADMGIQPGIDMNIAQDLGMSIQQDFGIAVSQDFGLNIQQDFGISMPDMSMPDFSSNMGLDSMAIPSMDTFHSGMDHFGGGFDHFNTGMDSFGMGHDAGMSHDFGHSGFDHFGGGGGMDHFGGGGMGPF